MADTSHTPKLFVGKFEPSKMLQMIVIAMAGLGTLGTIAGILMNPGRGWPAYLTAFFFVSSLSVGGLFFIAMNGVAKTGWSVSSRRFTESFTAFIPVILIGGLLLMLGVSHLYTWSDPEVTANSPMIAAKTLYLNVPFMIVRMLVFTIGTFLFARAIVGNSTKQDLDGSENHTKRNLGLSIGFILFYAITYSLFSVDLLMSLLPTWYSTIFGVYLFSGMIQSTMALLILVLIYATRSGFVQGYINEEHIHDIAKYAKGFTIFWAYIAFSQFMLIWYANIPEETEFYLMRSANGWTQISLLLIIGKFAVPFLALLPRQWKRTQSHLIVVCSWILVMQFVDVFWLVYPNFNGNHLVFGLYEVAPLVAFIGIFLLLMARFLKNHSLVPLKDPRLNEAIHHHVTY